MQTKDILLTVKLIGAGACTFLANMLGGWDMALKVLVIMTVLDYATGVLAAIYLQKLSSDISYRGIIKKIGIYIIVTVACALDGVLEQFIKIDNVIVLRTMAIGFYVATEGISILENLSKTELPIPDIIKKTLIQLKKQGDGENEGIS